ncbi:hypothetical protein HPULCUR_006032 [Helicostylum pulchrum]|uniref:Uncharacterized protein n=1 Tax=Helicostylum pulchrum TaxID=562976 RepID=A0ABP9Y0R3_9FUNG
MPYVFIFNRNELTDNRNETLIPVIIDIKHLLEAAHQLKELKLFDCTKVISSWQNTNLVETMENISLTKLKISVEETSTSTLKYIVTLLKDVKVLYLRLGNIKVEESISENEATIILKDLDDCISNMEKVAAYCVYNEIPFSFEFNSVSEHYKTSSIYCDIDEDDFDLDVHGDKDNGN